MTTESNHGAELCARMLDLAGEVAAARGKAARDAVALERRATEFENLHQELGNAHRRNRVLEQQVLALFGPAAAPADQGAKVRAAIADARHVFEGQKVAEDVLHYLEQVLAAGAPVPAQTGITPGTANASSAKETLAPLGAAPTLVAGSEWPAWARDLDKVATAMKQIEVAAGELFGQLANTLGTVGADTFDQAAAAMAAESAEKVADAERSVAARDQAHMWLANAAPSLADAASTPTVIAKLVVEVDTTQLDAALAKAEQLTVLLAGTSANDVPLVELACEMRSKALDIGQPVDVTLQLLMLVEQRRTNELLRTAHDEVKWARTRYEQSQRQFS